MKDLHPNKPEQVDAFLAASDYAFTAEVQALREIIKGAHAGITEQVKWNAPSFSYGGQYMATFNFHSAKRVHLVWHNGVVLKDPTGLLEGDYPDRRMTYFTSMADVTAKRDAFADLVRQWVAHVDSGTG